MNLACAGDGRVTLEEFTRLRYQLVAFQMRLEELDLAIRHYKPEEHAPECLAEGGQGMILVGKDLASGERVAIKVERAQPQQPPGQPQQPAMQREYDVLQAMADYPTFPSVRHFGRQILNSSPQATDCWVMVMDLLGCSIRQLWWEQTRGARGFVAPTAVALLIAQLLERFAPLKHHSCTLRLLFRRRICRQLFRYVRNARDFRCSCSALITVEFH